jgi:hypothetical protein
MPPNRRKTGGATGRVTQAFFMADKSVEYTQPMDIQKLIDYGPLDAALSTIGG